MKTYFILPFLLFGAACVSPAQVTPVVSQYNGDSVSIQLNGTQMTLMSQADREIAFQKADAEAARICSKGHKKNAEYTSTRTLPVTQYSSVMERLYLCLN